MRKTITTLIRHWVKAPVKISLTLLAVALGTGILILSFSAEIIIEEEIIDLMNKDGMVVQVANGEWNSEGGIEQQRPTKWNMDIIDRFKSDSDTITNVSMIYSFPLDQLSINSKSYKVRKIIGSDPNYLDIYDLNIVTGQRMSQNDFDSGLPKVWISNETAELLFGSAQDAIGQKVAPPSRMNQRANKNSSFTINQYTVTGVYETPTEVARRSNGIADIIFPMTALMPTNKQGPDVLNFLSGRLIVKSSSTSVDKIRSEINQIVVNTYSQDTLVTVWEGSPDGESNYMNELRQTINIFTITIKMLGIVLLLTSSIGIFSIMVVEALGRKKEIAIERALGASKLRVITEFWQWSIMLSLLGAILGVIISLPISNPVLGTMTPLLSELTNSEILKTTVRPMALFNGVILALLCGGLLGVLPSFSATKGDISDTLRDA